MDAIRGTVREDFSRGNPHDNFDIVSLIFYKIYPNIQFHSLNRIYIH